MAVLLSQSGSWDRGHPRIFVLPAIRSEHLTVPQLNE